MVETNNYNAQLMAYNNFIESPSAKTALLFVMASHKYIGILASKWREVGMTRKAKIHDIMAEMFLILLEDFSAKKAILFKSALSYLDIKLRRLVNPSRRHVFTDLDAVCPIQLAVTDKFTSEKLEMVDEIVKIVRHGLFENYDNGEGLIPFLFIHIYPKVRWISELIAAKQHSDAKSRYSADAKRIERFNANLRKDFEKLNSGDWRDILRWSQSERRHLAWKIINISPTEIPEDVMSELSIFENWRENFNTNIDENIPKLSCAEHLFNSMNKCSPTKMAVAEEAVPWGKPIDFLSIILGNIVEDGCYVQEKEKQIDGLTLEDMDPEDDAEFMECALEFSQWFGEMLDKRNKKASENRVNR